MSKGHMLKLSCFFLTETENFLLIKNGCIPISIHRGIQKRKADDLYQNKQPSYECFEKRIPNAYDVIPRKRLLARVDSHEL